MSLEELYNRQFEVEDDEEDDSDWEPPTLGDQTIFEIPKWFCINCTMSNIGDGSHCNLCGEHRESGILKHGFLASPLCRAEDFSANNSFANDQLQDNSFQVNASKNLTAIGFDERMLLHEEVSMKSHPHPERPDRLRAIAVSLATAGIFPGRCTPILAREINKEELLKIHAIENVEAVECTSHAVSSYFTPDTYANQFSSRAARLAAGLCFDLAAAIYTGKAKNGFALVRPPGHHAGVKQAMGFCLHNNAALAASAAQVSGAKRVVIIDWDVHHGNGTQEIFEKSKSVLYISLHRHEKGKFYPGTGSAYEVGVMGAEGYCVNIPWSRGGVGDNDYIFAFQHIVLPIATEFRPDFTIISAGFDAARGDPLGGCDVTPAGYARMMEMCCELSREGYCYNLRSISHSATEVIKILLGERQRESPGEIIPTKFGLQTVMDVLEIQLKYWPSLESKFSELKKEWGTYAFQHEREKVKRRRKRRNAPTWWKWGRKRWLFRVWLRNRTCSRRGLVV